MIRILLIKSPDKGSLFYTIASRVFETRKFEYIRKAEVREVIVKTDPDFILTDVKPVNGNDLMSMVSELDELTRLRAFYINLFHLKKKLRFPSLYVKDRIFSLLFESKTLKKSE